MDCRYSAIEVAVIEYIGSNNPVVKSLGIKNYSNNTLSINYHGNNQGDEISLAEVLLKGETYIQGSALHQHGGQMYYYRIKERKNPNLQYLAFGIQPEWVIYETTVDYARKHNLKSYSRGESYAWAIAYNGADGSHTRGFPHIWAI